MDRASRADRAATSSRLCFASSFPTNSSGHSSAKTLTASSNAHILFSLAFLLSLETVSGPISFHELYPNKKRIRKENLTSFNSIIL